MRCKALKITLNNGVEKIYVGIENLAVVKGELRFLTEKDYCNYDLDKVAFYECLGYELESILN